MWLPDLYGCGSQSMQQLEYSRGQQRQCQSQGCPSLGLVCKAQHNQCPSWQDLTMEMLSMAAYFCADPQPMVRRQLHSCTAAEAASEGQKGCFAACSAKKGHLLIEAAENSGRPCCSIPAACTLWYGRTWPAPAYRPGSATIPEASACAPVQSARRRPV